MFKKALLIGYLSAMSFSHAVTANDDASIEIALVQDAQVFARFDDELPYGVNYFTKLAEVEINDFYDLAYGEPTYSERMRGRLTLHYSKNNYYIKLIISTQKTAQQVDLLITRDDFYE